MSRPLFDDDASVLPPEDTRKPEGASRNGGTSGPTGEGTPLAERMRPRTLDEVVGQEHILAPGTPLRDGDRARPPAVDHLLGTTGHRQDHGGAHHRRDDAGALRPVQRGPLGRQGDQRGHGDSRAATTHHRPKDDRVRRRDSPLQQGAAGRVPPPRRSRRHRPHRRDNREPVVRGQRGAPVTIEGVRAAAADLGAHRSHPSTRARRSRARPRRIGHRRHRRGDRGDRPVRQRRRAHRPQPARVLGVGGRPNRERRPVASTCLSWSSRSSGVRSCTTKRAKSTTT